MADPTQSAYDRQTVNLATQRRVVIPGVEITVPKTYDDQYASWQILRDCYGGERQMKKNAQNYIKKLASLDKGEHDTYVDRAYFYNAVRRTHIGLIGSLFRKPPEFTLPASSKINLKHVTRDGQTMRAFSRKIAHELILVGRFGVLVDFSSDPKNAYMAGYNAEDIYAWRYLVWKDRKIVDRIVLIENEETNTEWSTTTNQIYRILRLDPDPERPGELLYSQTVIRPNATDPANYTVEEVKVSSQGRPIRHIPFVFFNPTSLLPECEIPQLIDIATINVSHFQSTAHLEHGRFYAGMPTYVTSGEGDDPLIDAMEGLGRTNPRRVGPNTLWELGKDSKAWILEFTGHGLIFLENAVDSKQLQMQSLGGRLISSTRRAAAMSDEAWQLLETGDEATMMDVAYQMDEGVELLLRYMAHIRGEIDDLEAEGFLAEFNKEFVRSELTAREIRALQSLYERQIIPADVMYYALREVGVIPQEYSLEDFTKLMNTKEQIYEPKVPAGQPGNNGARNPGSGSFGGGNPGTRPPTSPNPNPSQSRKPAGRTGEE